MAQRIVEDMPRHSSGTEVRVHVLPSDPGWDIDENFAAVDEVASTCGLDPANEDILAHMTTGNYVWQTSMFAAVEAGIVPGGAEHMKRTSVVRWWMGGVLAAAPRC